MLQTKQTDNLVSRRSYPADVLAKMEAMPPLALQIADRWMLGWPKQVKALLAQGIFLQALREQEETEAKVQYESRAMTHLAKHEIAELYGLSPAPPTP